MTELSQHGALVTGASGGIGAALVARLCDDAAFCRVFAVSRSATGSSALRELQARYPQLSLHDADCTTASSLRQLHDHLQDAAVALTLVCNCIGLLHDAAADVQPEKRLEDCDSDAMLRLFQRNAMAPLLLAQALKPLLPRRESGVFLSTSARVGSIGDNRLGGWYSYRASKAAHNMLLKNLSIEFGRSHRRWAFVCYHPGTVDTGLSRPFQSNVPDGKLFSPEKAAEYLDRVRRGIDAEDTGKFFAWDGEQIAW